jgi:hypothetical protein
MNKAKKFDKKKKLRLEKSVEEEEEEDDDDDTEFVVDKFDREEDFIPFEDENEEENARHVKHAGHNNLHENLRTNHSIDDEFNPGNFFDDMHDERAFERLYS